MNDAHHPQTEVSPWAHHVTTLRRKRRSQSHGGQVGDHSSGRTADTCGPALVLAFTATESRPSPPASTHVTVHPSSRVPPEKPFMPTLTPVAILSKMVPSSHQQCLGRKQRSNAVQRLFIQLNNMTSSPARPQQGLTQPSAETSLRQRPREPRGALTKMAPGAWEGPWPRPGRQPGLF